MPSILESLAIETGLPEKSVCLAVTGALRRLHRVAWTDQKGLTAVALETYMEFGSEACWHLVNLFEIQRVKGHPELPWDETLYRLDARLRHYNVLVEKWRNLEEADDAPGG